MKLNASSPVSASDTGPFDRTALAQRIKDDINAACVRLYADTEPRTHLGASIVGSDCIRKSWYSFRWFRLPSFEGRMLRLFNRGHREEHRWLEWLREAGLTVWDLDPTNEKQFRVAACEGHYGGSLDGIAVLPYPELQGERFLVEFKTHNDNSFKKLKKDKVRVAKPEHWRQMCQYGEAYKFKRALYFAINKNDDEIHIECLELDWSVGTDMVARGYDIITTRVPPPRIAARPDFWECKMCEFNRVCFFQERPVKNCRSCTYATPAAEGTWFCNGWQQTIPAEVIKTGCDNWAPLA